MFMHSFYKYLLMDKAKSRVKIEKVLNQKELNINGGVSNNQENKIIKDSCKCDEGNK